MSANIELLSPAGDPEKLKIALAYGADAVYGGVSHFSLRIRSGREFEYDTFGEAINYAHSLGKKVYTTINGFPFNSQIGLVEKHIEKIAALNPDAMIISTPGVMRMCQKIAPTIPLHLSTQANVLNYADAAFYYDLGVKRIIAAREVSLKDLEEIKKRLPDLELEVFVHGSMCFAFSGRCLISSLQMGRVPNRGSCANDCRMPYEVYVKNPEHNVLMRVDETEEGSYIFNAKDLCLIEHIDEIVKSGAVDSVKIEGRTKSTYYAGITSKAYRMALDDALAGKFDATRYIHEIDTTKNRGLSDNYLVHKPHERLDTQNLESPLSEGSHQVVAMVMEDGLHFLCKDKVYPNDEINSVIEIVLPLGETIPTGENEIGKVWIEEGKGYISFKKILTQSGKELESVHSGNVNPVVLPLKLPAYTFLRRRIEE